jgi:hypothetical protein
VLVELVVLVWVAVAVTPRLTSVDVTVVVLLPVPVSVYPPEPVLPVSVWDKLELFVVTWLIVAPTLVVVLVVVAELLLLGERVNEPVNSLPVVVAVFEFALVIFEVVTTPDRVDVPVPM